MEGNSTLEIGDYEVTEAGWYTFRYVLRDDDGVLGADFVLADRRGGPLLSMPAGETLFAELAPSDLATENVGSGYPWIVSIAEGLELPIDRRRVRRGR